MAYLEKISSSVTSSSHHRDMPQTDPLQELISNFEQGHITDEQLFEDFFWLSGFNGTWTEEKVRSLLETFESEQTAHLSQSFRIFLRNQWTYDRAEHFYNLAKRVDVIDMSQLFMLWGEQVANELNALDSVFQTQTQSECILPKFNHAFQQCHQAAQVAERQYLSFCKHNDAPTPKFSYDQAKAWMRTSLSIELSGRTTNNANADLRESLYREAFKQIPVSKL